jgi:hypothetical protein
VISVKDYWNSVLLGHRADVESPRHGAGDGGSIVFVIESFSTVELQKRNGIVRTTFRTEWYQKMTSNNSLEIHQMKTE